MLQLFTFIWVGILKPLSEMEGQGEEGGMEKQPQVKNLLLSLM